MRWRAEQSLRIGPSLKIHFSQGHLRQEDHEAVDQSKDSDHSWLACNVVTGRNIITQCSRRRALKHDQQMWRTGWQVKKSSWSLASPVTFCQFPLAGMSDPRISAWSITWMTVCCLTTMPHSQDGRSSFWCCSTVAACESWGCCDWEDEDDSISTAPYPYWKPLAHPQIQKGIGCVLDIPGIRSLCWPRLEFCTGVGMGPNPRVFRGNGVEKYVKPAVIMGTGTLLTGRVRFVQKAVGGPSPPLPFPLPFLSPPLSSLSPLPLPLFSLSSSFLPFPFPFPSPPSLKSS